MAQRTIVEILLTARDTTNKVFRGLFGGLNRLKNAVFSLRNAFIALISGATIKFFADLVKRGGEVIGVQRSFARAVGDTAAAMKTLRTASSGLISNYDLMVGLNRALALGSARTADEFGEIAKTAITLGRALGVDAKFALESLNLGIGRQSKLILDNLGILVDIEGAYKRYASAIGKTVEQLTEEERRTAFRTAALEAARRSIEQLGGAAETNADKIIRLEVAFKNAKDRLAELLATSPFLAEVFQGIAEFATDVATVLHGSTDQIETLFHELGVLAANAFALALQKTLNALLFIETKPGGLAERLFGQFKLEPFRLEGPRENIAGARRVIAGLAAQAQVDAERRTAGRQGVGRTAGTSDISVADQDAAALAKRLEILQAQFRTGVKSEQDFRAELRAIGLEMFNLFDATDLTNEGFLTLAGAFESLRDTAIATEGPLAGFASAFTAGLFEASGAIVNLDQKLGELTANSFVELSNAALVAFGEMVGGAEATGRSFQASMLSAISSIASSYAAMFLGEGLAALARGTAFGFLFPAAGASGIAAAGKFFAAAAAMQAVAGLAGAAAGRSAGGGGGGGASGAAARTNDVAREQAPLTVVLKGPMWRATAPEFVDLVAEAFNEATGRNVIVQREE